MRSPLKPGYAPLTLDLPSWATNTGDEVEMTGGTDVIVSDTHIGGFAGRAVNINGVTGLTIERCTFYNVGQAISLLSCTNVTVRDCAFWGMNGGVLTNGGHAVIFDQCDTVVIEDCWAHNPLAWAGDVSDVFNSYRTDNVTIRRNYIFGAGDNVSVTGIVVGDGVGFAGGDNLVVEDNVLIDADIALFGTNNACRRNVILNRGLVSAVDGKLAGIRTWWDIDLGLHPQGPTEVTSNVVRWYKSTGQLAPEIQIASEVTTTRTSNPVAPLIDEYSRWNPAGYYGWED